MTRQSTSFPVATAAETTRARAADPRERSDAIRRLSDRRHRSFRRYVGILVAANLAVVAVWVVLALIGRLDTVKVYVWPGQPALPSGFFWPIFPMVICAVLALATARRAFPRSGFAEEEIEREIAGAAVSSPAEGGVESSLPKPTRETPPVSVQRRGFAVHVLVYVVISSLLVAGWALGGGGFFWPVFTIVVWGIGVLVNGYLAFRPLTLVPLFGWCVFLPVALLALLRTPVEAGLAAALVGGFASVSGVWSRTLRHLVPLTAATSAVSWGVSVAIAAWLVPEPWLVVALPLAVVAALFPLRLLGAPRFVNNPLARTQQPWLVVVHTARLGGDLMTTAVLVAASTSVALALRGHLWAAAAGAGFVLAVLACGWVSLRRATRRTGQGSPRRVAAVVVDGRPPEHGELTGTWPAESPEYRDVEGTLARYRPHVEEAARQGAEVIVLPEVSFFAENGTSARWCAEVEAWARALDVAIVAPYFDAATPRNTLAVIDKSGVVAHHDKQHPARGAEPPCLTKMEVGPHRLANRAALSTAICVDLDYSDTARSARRAGALLAVPSNDWFGGFEVLHHESAVWAAVMGGVPVVRATGHGISSIYDGAGHVLKQQSSAGGPVVLVADVRG